MTKEDKELLLKDLCARLPYGVKVCAGEDLAMTLRQIDYKCFCESWENEDFKCHSRWMLPYLRPMSSMTEEEFDDMFNQFYSAQEEFFRNCSNVDTIGKLIANGTVRYDWLNKNMFDYRGLIRMGLALEAPEGMYADSEQKKEKQL